MKPTNAVEMVDLAVAHLLDGVLADATRRSLVAYLETPDAQRTKELAGKPSNPVADARSYDEKVRGLLHLILMTPEFQLG